MSKNTISISQLSTTGKVALVSFLAFGVALGLYLLFVIKFSGSSLGSEQIREGSSIGVGGMSLTSSSGGRLKGKLGPFRITSKDNPFRSIASIWYQPSAGLAGNRYRGVGAEFTVKSATGEIVHQSSSRTSPSRSKKKKSSRTNTSLNSGVFELSAPGTYTFHVSLSDSGNASIYDVSFEVRKKVARISPLIWGPLGLLVVVSLILLIVEGRKVQKGS